MTWNYRVLSEESGGEERLRFVEVYYDEAGKPRGYCDASLETHSCRQGDEDAADPESLKWTLTRMLEALERPTLYVEGETLVERAPEPAGEGAEVTGRFLTTEERGETKP